METIDIIILIAFLSGAVLGYMKGAIKQIATMAGLVLGLVVARMLFASVGAKVAEQLGTSLTIGQVLAFVFIWVVVPMGCAFVGSILTEVVKAIKLGFINQWLGAGVGSIKYLLFASVFINAIEYIDVDHALIKQETKEKSYTYYPLKTFAEVFIPEIKAKTQDIIQSDN